MEECAAPHGELAKLVMQSNIELLTKEEHYKAQEDLTMAILSDPCLAHFDYKKRSYLLTDFSKKGVGHNLCQPADDAVSMAAMRREMEGGDCEFLKPNSNLMLKSTGFGARRTRDEGQGSRFAFPLGRRVCPGLGHEPKESSALECEIFCNYRLLCLALYFVL